MGINSEAFRFNVLSPIVQIYSRFTARYTRFTAEANSSGGNVRLLRGMLSSSSRIYSGTMAPAALRRPHRGPRPSGGAAYLPRGPGLHLHRPGHGGGGHRADGAGPVTA